MLSASLGRPGPGSDWRDVAGDMDLDGRIKPEKTLGWWTSGSGLKEPLQCSACRFKCPQSKTN